MKFLFSLIAFILITSSALAENSHNLFSLELYGEPLSVSFINEDDLIISSNKAILSKLSQIDKKHKWKNNLIYPSQNIIKADKKFCILINQEKNFIDLYDHQKNQLIWSLNYADKRSPYKTYKLIKYFIANYKKKFVGFFLENNSFKIFNDESIVAESILNTSEEYLNFIYNDETYLLTDARFDNSTKTFKISQQSMKDINDKGVFSQSPIEKTLTISKKFARTFSLKGYFFIEFSSQNYGWISIDTGILTEKNIRGNNLKIFTFFNSNQVILMDDSKVYILDLAKNKIDEVNLPQELKLSFISQIDTKESQKLIFYSKSVKIDEFDLSIKKFDPSKTVEVDNCLIKNVFNHHHKENTKSLVVCQNLHVFLYDHSKNKIIWDRFEGLTQLTFSRIVQYTTLGNSLNQDSLPFHKLEDFAYKTQISNLVSNLLSTFVEDIKDIVLRVKRNFEILIDSKQQSSSSQSKEYNHALVLFTEFKDLFIFDIYSGELKYIKLFSDKNLVDLENQAFSPLISLKFTDDKENFHHVKFDLSINHLISTQYKENTAKILQNIKFSEYANPEFLFNNKDSKTIIDTINLEKEIILKENNHIFAVKVNKHENSVKPAFSWNINFAETSNIIEFKLANIHRHTPTTYLSNGQILYKYLDQNLALVLHTEDNINLNLLIINSKSGNSLYQTQITNVDFTQKIQTLFEENIVIVSYVRKQKSVIRSEIFVVEILKNEIEHSFINLMEKIIQIEKPDQNPLTSNIDSSDLVFQEATYSLPKRIKSLFASETKLNVSNKQIILVFENNLVYMIDRRLIGARRPIMKNEKPGVPPTMDPLLNSPYIDFEAPPYAPIIQIDYKKVLHENFADDFVEDIVVSQTEYESTFILCTLGVNVKCHDVFPDKNYDSLNVSFAYHVIALFLVGIFMLTYILRKYVKKLEFRNAFLHN